jgi:putative phosphoesterase
VRDGMRTGASTRADRSLDEGRLGTVPVVRIAVLNDIHGNLPALETVLAEIDRDPVDAIVCGGDIVLGAQPAECLELMRSRSAHFVRGNCERSVLERDDETAAWCHDRLDDDARAILAELPTTVSLDGVLFCHGSPRSDEEILTAATPDDVVAEALEGVAEETVVGGHTHHQFDRRVGRHRLVNAGSVGLPYEGDAAAFWALVADGDVELRRTPYDVAAAVERLRATGYPGLGDFIQESLVEPMPPDEVIAHFERLAGRGT